MGERRRRRRTNTGSLFRFPTSTAHSSRVPRRELPEVKAQIIEGPLIYSSALSLIGGVHVGARALLDINLNGVAISLDYPSGGGGGAIFSFK
jgi:hypothetical protein